MTTWLRSTLLSEIPWPAYLAVAGFGLACSVYNLFGALGDQRASRQRVLSVDLRRTLIYAIAHSSVLILAQLFNLSLFIVFGTQEAYVITILSASWLAALSGVGTVWRYAVAGRPTSPE